MDAEGTKEGGVEERGGRVELNLRFIPFSIRVISSSSLPSAAMLAATLPSPRARFRSTRHHERSPKIVYQGWTGWRERKAEAEGKKKGEEVGEGEEEGGRESMRRVSVAGASWGSSGLRRRRVERMVFSQKTWETSRLTKRRVMCSGLLSGVSVLDEEEEVEEEGEEEYSLSSLSWLSEVGVSVVEYVEWELSSNRGWLCFASSSFNLS